MNSRPGPCPDSEQLPAATFASQRGQALVVFTLALAALLGLVAFTIDVGGLMEQRRQIVRRSGGGKAQPA